MCLVIVSILFFYSPHQKKKDTYQSEPEYNNKNDVNSPNILSNIKSDNHQTVFYENLN